MYSLSPLREKYISTSYNRRMDDMNCILDNGSQGSIYLGNIESASDPSNLSKHKIHGVLSICMTKVPYEVSSSLNHYQHIYLEDAETENIARHFDQSYNFIEKARQNGNVLVHCMAGISRSATLVAAYLMKKNKIGAKEAIQLLERKRWQVYPNDGFLRQLQQYEKAIFQNTNESPIRHQSQDYSGAFWYLVQQISKTLYNTPGKYDQSEYQKIRNKYLPDDGLSGQKNRPLDISIDNYRRKIQQKEEFLKTPEKNSKFNDIYTPQPLSIRKSLFSETQHKSQKSRDSYTPELSVKKIFETNPIKQSNLDGLSYVALELNQRDFQTKRMDFDNKYSAKPSTQYTPNPFQLNNHMSKLDQLLNSFNRKSVK